TGISRVCASANPEMSVVGGNEVYCKPSKGDAGCAKGYTCRGFGDGGSGVSEVEIDGGICKDANGNSQVSQGRWVDVGFCDSDLVRCWLDRTSVEGNLKEYMAVQNLSSVNSLVLGSQDFKELDEVYKNVREKLNGLRQDVKELGGVGSRWSVVGGREKLVEIVKGLDEVAGVGDEAGQGANVDKAEALALKASAYMAMVELLIENPENAEVVSEGARGRPEGSGAVDVSALLDGSSTGSTEGAGVEKIKWGDLVSEDYAKSSSNGLFIRLEKSDKWNPVSGAFDLENQKVVIIVSGNKETYFVSRDESGKIIFSKQE
ncbi:MAG: hypothetical protein KJ592_00835, partial [Nanoarchaeota archaeon]|nr:hypothetical protein [Nanoarchaeota archaeon]